MKPAAFSYHRAGSVSDVLVSLADRPEAKVIAGGQSLLTLMNLRLARPDLLIDIGRLDELRRVFDDSGRVLIGALLTHREVGEHPVIATRHPLIREMVGHIGHVGIRNRGTLGGTLAHADPAGELPAAMVLLGAQIHAESQQRGRRVIAAEDFFVAHFVSALEPDELITWVEVPDLPPRTGWGFVEYAQRHGDYATAGAAVLVTVDPAGRPSRVRGVLISAGDRPILVTGTAPEIPDGPGLPGWLDWAGPQTRDLQPAVDDVRYVCELSAQALAEAAARATDCALAAVADEAGTPTPGELR